jgi:predicted ATPase
MGKTQDPGSGSRADEALDAEVARTLPMPLSSFVGRERELDELPSLLRAGKRLVTLVGIGGIGKTRLALELGFSAHDLGWDHVYFVELATLADPGLVAGAVLESVGAGSSHSPLRAAVEHLGVANALLVLDCCEHVLGAARAAAEELVRGCPFVTVLATSRSPLDADGELVWPVPPLSLERRADAGEAGASDAARLFADRASHAQPRSELGAATAPTAPAARRIRPGTPARSPAWRS